jgi:hypothetical protein
MFHIRNGGAQLDTDPISQLDRGGRGRVVDPDAPILIIIDPFDGAIIDLLGGIIIILIHPLILMLMPMMLSLVVVIIIMVMLGKPTMGPRMVIRSGDGHVENQPGSDEKPHETHQPFLNSTIHKLSFLKFRRYSTSSFFYMTQARS